MKCRYSPSSTVFLFEIVNCFASKLLYRQTLPLHSIILHTSVVLAHHSRVTALFCGGAGVMLRGQRALVIGVSNARSIAWGVADRWRREGAEVFITYQVLLYETC